MPTTCIIKGCKSRSFQGCGIKFHRLPWRDDLLFKQWLIRAGKSEHELTGKRMVQFKNLRMCSLHFNAEDEGTAKALPLKNLPDFERQEAVAGLLQLNVAHMESTQRNVYVHQTNPSTSKDNTGNIPADAVGPNPMIKPETIAYSVTIIEDTANILDTAEDIIPMTKHKTTANDDYMAFAQKSLLTPQWTSLQKRKRKLFSDSTSQVTPKKNKVSIGIPRTPAKQKHTQVTPKQKRSAKMSTDISIGAETQTETLSYSLKYTKTTQRDSKITCEKSSQVNISKLETLKTSDKDLRRYTGIKDYKLFTILHKYLVSCCSHIECETIPGHGDPNKLFSHIGSENQLLLVLYKLKGNPIDSVLASNFDISTGRISEIFKFWIKQMYRKFKIIKIWPSKENVQKHMPLSTQKHFPDLVAIADCVEFCTQVPGGVPQINVTYRTGELRETPGYIFNTADIIGKGSISIVYFGRKKSNGNVVAAKVFNASGSHNIETEVLSSLDHENIVKFLDFQYEKDSHLPVLIMEYCEDGSLQIMLDKPEFMFGLLEDELIIFLKDFKCAIFYLKQKNIVHRDIKPGNILRARKEDGRSQYKLTDFSSARKLTDDETYDSVHGTMEYMCPAMFSKGILGKSIPKKFDITTDLWSIGVTIYYAVVGTVSFRPFAGREDKNTITLQDLIIDVIAGLLDGKQVLSYEQFFIKVIVVDAKIKFTIFYCCIGQDIVIYMNPKDKYANLQEEIAVVTEIPASNQLLLVAGQELTEIVCVTDEMNSYPLSIQQGRLFLYQYQIIVTTSVGLIKILELPDTSLRHSLNDDARMAKKCTAVAYHICRIHKCVIDSQVQLIQSLSNLRRYIYRIICQSNICILDLKRCSDETRKRLSIVFTVFPGFNSMTKLFIEFHDPGNVREVVEMKKLITEISKLLEETSFDAFQKKIEGRVQEVEKYIEVLTSKIHEQEMAANTDCVRCCEAEHCHGKIERKKKEILDVMNIFLRHMRYETLHDHEQFIHESEKHNLDVLCSKLLSTVQGHCVPAYYQLYENVMKHL
ncbi:hypothetical protein ACJMK2_016052, partial [Sinanodonta woodiana]